MKRLIPIFAALFFSCSVQGAYIHMDLDSNARDNEDVLEEVWGANNLFVKASLWDDEEAVDLLTSASTVEFAYAPVPVTGGYTRITASLSSTNLCTFDGTNAIVDGEYEWSVIRYWPRAGGGTNTRTYGQGVFVAENCASAGSDTTATFLSTVNWDSVQMTGLVPWHGLTNTPVALAGDAVQGGTSTITGEYTVVTFPHVFTQAAPSVSITMSDDFPYEASAKVNLPANTNSFTVQFSSAAGVITNAWDFFWLASPNSASGTVGYTDAQAVAAVDSAKNFGTIITYDQGTGSNEIPTSAQVSNMLSGISIEAGDVYTSSNNVFDTGTVQDFDAITADSISINNTNMVTNGTFDADAEWSYDANWSIAGGVAQYASTTNTSIEEIYVDIGTVSGHTYQVSYKLTLSGSGVFFYPKVGGQDGVTRLVGGNYTENITAVNTDVFGFEILPALGGTVNATLDNVVIIDLSRATTINEGIITIGGETVTMEKIREWDAGVFSEVDPVWSAVSNEYYKASNPSNYVDQTVTNGLASSADLADYLLLTGGTMGGGDIYDGARIGKESYINLGGAWPGDEVFIQCGTTDASVTNGIGGSWFQAVAQNMLVLGCVTNGSIIFTVNGLDTVGLIKARMYDNGTWDFFGHTLSNAVFDGTFVGDGSAVSNMYLPNSTGTPHRLFYTDANGDVGELGYGAVGQYLKSSGTASTPTWNTIDLTATATNVGIADLTNVPAASSFIVGDGTNYIETSLADTKTLLGVGSLTNVYVTNIQDTATLNYHIFGNGTFWETQPLITTMLAVDGAGSGLDADLLDGNHAAAFGVVASGISQFSDVDTTGAAAGKVLKYDGAEWVVSNDLTTAVDTNALEAMWQADDSTTSNNLVTLYTAADVALSNSLVALDTSLSNSLVSMYTAADTAVSNSLVNIYQSGDDAVSNSLVSMYEAADTTLSNNLTLAYQTDDATVLASAVKNSSTQAVNVTFAITNLPAGSLVYDDDESVEEKIAAATNGFASDIAWDIGGTNVTLKVEGAVTIGTNEPTAGATLDVRGYTILWQGDQANWVGTDEITGDLVFGRNGTVGTNITLRIDDSDGTLYLGPNQNYPSIKGLGTTNIQFTIGVNTYIFPE